MRKKFPREVLHSKAEWKKVNINMHGELEPATLEISFLKGATHTAKTFPLPDNLRSVNTPEVLDFVAEHKVIRILLTGHLENPTLDNPHGYIEYEIDDAGLDIVLFRVNGDPHSRHVTVKVEEVHHFNNHDNKWVYHELEELITQAGLLKKKVA